MMSKKGLSKVLGYSYSDLIEIARKADEFYTVYEKKQKKPNGKTKVRRIETTKNTILEVIQRKILGNILKQTFSLPEFLHGGVKGKSNITNAQQHLGLKYHFCTDLKSFYPHISSKQVNSILLDSGKFSPDSAWLITRFTTFQGHLPQGAPTSPFLANLVFLPMDKELLNFCNTHNILYTRFVDDLVFSSSKDFKESAQQLRDLIISGGFKISHPKTYYKIGPVEVTGILVKHNSLTLTDSFKAKDVSMLKENAQKSRQRYAERIIKIQSKRITPKSTKA